MFNFTHDVFISYAHQNNEDEWVDAFHAELLIQLSDLLPREPTVWRDRKLSGADIFTDEIKDQLEKSKVLVTVLAPKYFRSEWCCKELKAFHDAALKHPCGLKIGNKSRIVKAIKVNVTDEDPPLEITDPTTTGFKFFLADEQAGEDRKYTHDRNAAGYELFRGEVTRIAHHIALVVKEIDKQSEPPKPKSGKPAVFLAETVAELDSYRKRIRDELTLRGYSVLPRKDEALIYAMPQYEQRINEYLSQANFSIHLVGNNYGLIPELPPDVPQHSIIELQNSWAARYRGKNNFESLIWIPDGVVPQDERQEKFLDYLLYSIEAQQHAEPWRSSFESFKQKVLGSLERLEKRMASAAIPTIPKKRIYLMCDKRDSDSIPAVSRFLHSQGFGVFVSPSVNGLGPATAHRDKCLKLCDATLIYYGTTDLEWVDLMMLDVIDAPTLRKSGYFECKALYLADPKLEYLTVDAEVLKHDGNSLETSLLPFIECLRGSGSIGGVRQ